MKSSPFDFKPIQLDQLVEKLGEAFRQSPAHDLDRNLRDGLSGWLRKLDLVTREEFDIQTAVLQRTREKLEAFEARIKALEASQTPKDPGPPDSSLN